MTQEKFLNLTKYVEELRTKLSNPSVPLKHQRHPQVYLGWLNLELKRSLLRLETEAVFIPKSK